MWWRNRGRDGWSPPVPVTLTELADDDPLAGLVDAPDLSDPAVQLADLTGDGLADLVRVRSGQVTYWPNLGHGRFAAPVLMTGSPRVRTDDGTQLLLGRRRRGRLRRPRAGRSGRGADRAQPVRHRLGRRRSLDPLVPQPIPGTVASVPGSSGRGDALLWCSPRGSTTGYVRYDPTVGSGYLLATTDNGAGLSARLEYDTAAAQAERDRLAGDPWPDEVPFPVAVVTATTVTDAVSGQSSRTEYRYHDGWFDERERSFEGFARVDRDELGDATRPTSRVVHHFVVGADRLPGNGPEHALLNRLLVPGRAPRAGRLARPGPAGAGRGVRLLRPAPARLPGRRSGHSVGGPTRAWVRVERTARHWFERTDDERVEERTLTYDAAGDVVAEQLRHTGTRSGTPVPEVVVQTTMTHAVHPTGSGARQAGRHRAAGRHGCADRRGAPVLRRPGLPGAGRRDGRPGPADP